MSRQLTGDWLPSKRAGADNRNDGTELILSFWEMTGSRKGKTLRAALTPQMQERLNYHDEQ